LNLSTTKREWFQHADFALVLAVAAIAVRVLWPGINAPIWLDEQMIAMNVRDRGFTRLVGQLDNDQSAPLGWLWVERALFNLFGQADWVLRLQPLVFGVGAVVVAWWFGRRWLGRLGSTALVALIGFNWATMLYSSQIKHYSADIFWALLLIALARWVIEEPHSYRRHLWWWGAAVVGSWLSNGATTSTPGIALVLVTIAVWRQPFLTWVKMAVPGVVWLGSFAAHYISHLRVASQNEYLNEFWASLGYPPPSEGKRDTLIWFANQVTSLLHETFYLDIRLPPTPAARSIFVVFSALAAAGLVVAFHRGKAFGFVLCAPLITASLLSLLRIVPLFGRLAFWTIPAVMVAVAHAVDFKPQRFKAMRWVAPVAFLLMLVPFVNSVRELVKTPEFDDRAAITWLRERHRTGDLTLIIANSYQAAEWYDGEKQLSPVYMVTSVPAGPDCDPAQLREIVRGHDRALVYAGVRLFPYMETPALLETQLATMGTVTERQRFGTDGVTYVVELSRSTSPGVTLSPDCIKIL